MEEKIVSFAECVFRSQREKRANQHRNETKKIKLIKCLRELEACMWGVSAPPAYS